MTSICDFKHDIHLGFSRSTFGIIVSRERVVRLMWNGNFVNRLCNLDHTRYLKLGLSRSKFEKVVSQEKDGQLTWDERDMDQSMTMTIGLLGWDGWVYLSWNSFKDHVLVDFPRSYLNFKSIDVTWQRWKAVNIVVRPIKARQHTLVFRRIVISNLGSTLNKMFSI